MPDKANTASYVLSISLFSLAAALVYFTVELTRVANQIPAILGSVEHTSEKIEPVVREVSAIRELVPPIISEVTELRKQIPLILEEVKQTRALVPPVLEEVKQTRQLMPAILKEVKQTRKLIPSILQEVEKTREALPPMLVKADKIVSDARQLGQKTSEGAVTGVITGIIKAPFKLVGGLGKSIFGSLDIEAQGLTKEDRDMSLNTANELVTSGKVGETRSWSNPDSGNKGSVTLKEEKVIDDRKCRVLSFAINTDSAKGIKKDVTVCLNDEAEWETLE